MFSIEAYDAIDLCLKSRCKVRSIFHGRMRLHPQDISPGWVDDFEGYYVFYIFEYRQSLRSFESQIFLSFFKDELVDNQGDLPSLGIANDLS